MSVRIDMLGKQMRLLAPYHPDLPQQARNLGGTFDRTENSWRFDARDEVRVRELAKSVYGTDGEDAEGDLVEIELTATADHSPTCSGIYFCGRCIATAFGRDSGAKLGANVVNLSGVVKSGGSMKNWETIIRSGATFLVRDLPVAALRKERGWEWKILGIDVNAEPDSSSRGEVYQELLDEKAKLEARLMEIEASLAMLDK